MPRPLSCFCETDTRVTSSPFFPARRRFAAPSECAPIARRANLLVLPLHGSLTPAEQDRALAPAAQQKLILATNVAESSITVEGVTAVIDSGLARIATHSPWSGLPTLHIGRISQASACQRAGRAGRTAPGTVLRLYPEEDYLRRPAMDAPEIAREELSQLLLTLRAMGIASPSDLDWLDAPPAEAVEHAGRVLDLLGAHGEMAARLARFPLPPRLARILVEAEARGVGEDGCLAAAVLSVGTQNGISTAIDLHARMEATLDPQTRQLVTQLKRMARPRKQHSHDDDALLISVLTGFPDRVAKLRAGSRRCSAMAAQPSLPPNSPPTSRPIASSRPSRPRTAVTSLCRSSASLRASNPSGSSSSSPPACANTMFLTGTPAPSASNR